MGRLVEVWGSWWSCGEAVGVGRLMGMWGSWWRCGEDSERFEEADGDLWELVGVCRGFGGVLWWLVGVCGGWL